MYKLGSNLSVLNLLANGDPVAVLRRRIVDIENPQETILSAFVKKHDLSRILPHVHAQM